MESKNNKIKNNFLDKNIIKDAMLYIDGLNINPSISNKHISHISKKLNGDSIMFDISKTDISKYLSNYQSDKNVLEYKLPNLFIDILHKIENFIGIKSEHTFLQIIDMNKGGFVSPHYDSSVDGFINYKCNIPILSEEYNLFIDKDIIKVRQNDLYCFESSLYKHWTKEFNSRRVLLSYGLILEYDKLNRREDDFRIRLSKRINKYFQK